jgi:tetratricopeptide (TPR) repeat protein
MAANHGSPEALPYARRYLEIFSGLAARYPDRGDFVLEQSNGYELVGHVLHVQGDSHGALENYLQCVALREGLVKAHPNDVVYKRNLMIGYGHVGDMLGSPVALSLGDAEGARVYYRKAVAIGEEIHDADPLDSTAKFDLAAGLERLGMVDVPASGTAESLAVLQRSTTMLESMVADDPNSVRVKRMLALVREYAGHRLRSLGRYSEAIANYRRSVALSDAILAIDPADRAALSQAVASGRGMATAMAMAGDRAGAIQQAQATIARAEAGMTAGTEKRSRQRYVAESRTELGSVCEILARRSPASRQRQDWEAARSALRQAISELEGMAAGGKLMSIETADLQRARQLLAEADGHLSASLSDRP